MQARLALMAFLLASAALAGCAARASEGEVFTALEAVSSAWEHALQVDANASLLEVVAFSGPQWKTAQVYAADPRGHEGTFGDGLAGSWVSTFKAGGNLLHIRTYADGRAMVVHQEPHEDKGRPAEGSAPAASDASGWNVDSAAAAATVAALPEFRKHVQEYPDAGFSYLYMPYSPGHPILDYFSIRHNPMDPDMEVLGWMVHGNVWIVTHFDAAGIDRGEAPTVAQAAVDAATGKVLSLIVHVPYAYATLLDVQDTYQDPLPTGLAPAVHEVPFEVPSQTRMLSGYLFCFEPSPLRSPVDPIRCELVDADGNVVVVQEGFFGVVEEPEPAGGTWKVRITHDTPLPRTVEGRFSLGGLVPVYYA